MCNIKLRKCNTISANSIEFCTKKKSAQSGFFLTFQTTSMSKEKEGKGKTDKKAPTKTLKEKRAAKAAKRKEKSRED